MIGKELKVCHITSMHDWNDDRVFERACKGLASEGVNVSLICTYHKKNDLIEGVHIIGIKERKGIARRIISSAKAFIIASRVEADIFHFHDPDLLPWMFILKWSGKNVIFDIHENYLVRIDKSNMPNFLKRGLKILWRGLEKKFIKISGGGSVISSSMAEMYEDTSVPLLVTSNIISLNRLKNVKTATEKDAYFSVYISGINSDARNCRQAIIAFEDVVKQYPQAKLKFFGRYYPEGYKQTLSDLSKSLHIENNVELQGMVNWEENFARLSKAHIGCVFYEDNMNNRVAIPNRLFEYMFSELAVLGEYFPEIKNIIDDTDCGVVVNSSNPNEISKAIIDLFSHPEILKQKALNGKHAVETKYNFEIAVKEMIAYYYKIIEKNNAPITKYL